MLTFLWYLVEIPLVACKVGTTLIGTVDFFEHQYAPMATIRALVYGQKTVWICSYCHSLNSETMSKAEEMYDLDEWMSRIRLDPKDKRKMYTCGASLCRYVGSLITFDQLRVPRPSFRFEAKFNFAVPFGDMTNPIGLDHVLKGHGELNFAFETPC